MKSMIGQIELIAAEQELAGEIVFDVLTTRLEYEQGIKNGELAACIMESLMNRKAIPESRWLYFTDADYKPGKSKASRADLFLRNARTVEQMHRHQRSVHREGPGSLGAAQRAGRSSSQPGPQF